MNLDTPLQARTRTGRGTRQCRRLRQQGEVPATLYGVLYSGEQRTEVSESLAVSAYDLYQLIEKGVQFVTVHRDGKQQIAVIKQVQRDTFGDDVLHVDLKAIQADRPVVVPVELTVKGVAKGVKDGGLLKIALRRILLSALPGKMPELVEINVEHLQVNERILVRDLDLGDGVTPASPGDQLVVHVMPGRGMKGKFPKRSASAPGADAESTETEAQPAAAAAE
ncbi:MAG: 50S ribosomal protein L25 [Planctomycetes bacterium]|nr:50S ribosomal protein L25 [Planctomycetota bacterium]